jgi:hypothetical protein
VGAYGERDKCSLDVLGKNGKIKGGRGLGFRELNIFNKALLAKQGWRLVHDPNSLVAQVLKAKYFPQVSFLCFELVNKPSYVWRSLMSAKELLQEGLTWRIGDGRSIKIWQDRWLPTPTSYTLQSHPRVIPDSSTVSMLIDHEVCEWNFGFITDIFSPEVAKVIVSIPLCPTLPPDRLVWRGTTNVIFSVRSAYHIWMELKARDNGSTSKEVGGHKVWSTIWRLGVLINIKIFMWRACNDLLSTKPNLLRRKIVENEFCPCCCRDTKSGIHALWNCPTV